LSFTALLVDCLALIGSAEVVIVFVEVVALIDFVEVVALIDFVEDKRST
jgi:hypothetical protein